MNKQLEQELNILGKKLKPIWNRQTDVLDKKTNKIYQCESLADCEKAMKECNIVEEKDKEYFLHRWYNFKTSTYCEDIFCELGAKHATNRKDHNVDIYIKNIPFDVKLTTYPNKLKNTRPYDLTKEQGKRDMIKWYAENQTREGRVQDTANRIYIVCDEKNGKNLEMKSNFNLIRKAIKKFGNEFKKNGIPEIEVEHNGVKNKTKVGLVYVTNR